MIIRKLDINGDWTFGASLNNFLSGNPAVGESIQTRCLSFLGNCFFDLGAGIDWFTFLGGSKSQLELQLAISAVILNTANVTGINQLSAVLNPVTRNFTVTFAVQTTYSVTAGTFSFDLGGGI